MKNSYRFLLIAVVSLMLAACAGKEVVDPVDTPDEEPMDDPTPVVNPINLNDPTDVCNINRPGSVLYDRVVYFDFDQSTIKSQYRDQVEAAGQFLAANPSANISLEGHADERGSREYNLGLGERRGNAASAVLSAMGANSGQVSVVSYGEEQPMCRESSESCWGQNRRVEFSYTEVGADLSSCPE